ncbi:MAG: peptidylprolyl isomerase [Xanthomonadaceae bacterium]|nr:peptidylprolyl isomerase [Xanthomonadaceae bacterium]
MDAILAQAPAGDWRSPDPENLLVMTLDAGRVVIELSPDHAPEHVANLRILAREGYFDGLSINRAQDNFVVQWGDPYGDDPAKARPLGSARTSLPAEFSTPIRDELPFVRLPDVDGWAPEVGFSDGFPVGRDPAAGIQWLAHCYGIVGAGRGNAPDSSNGTGLYVVIGQSPRQLDLNITTVGRVLEGMPLLAALPRGQGPGGFYEEPALRTPIRRIALAAALPEAERPRLERLDTASPSFAALVEARRNRAEAWYLRQAGHIDLCNVPLPVRERPGR